MNLKLVPFTFSTLPLGCTLPVLGSIMRMVLVGSSGLYTRMGSPSTRVATGMGPVLVMSLGSVGVDAGAEGVGGVTVLTTGGCTAVVATLGWVMVLGVLGWGVYVLGVTGVTG